MRSVNSKRALCLALTFVFCFGLMAFPAERADIVANASGYNEPVVRVGMYVNTTHDSRLFSAKTESANGFDIGYSNGTSFTKLFSLSNTAVIILPQTNADFQNGNCVAGNGNVGAYSTFVSKHGSYSEALSKARSVSGFVAVVNGGYEVRKNPSVTDGTNSPVNGGLMILDMQGNILFTFEDASKKMALRGQGGANVSFPMVHRTGKVNTYAYQGFFEYGVADGKLQMVNCIGLEDYTKCIMANEIGTNVSAETRKAFSVLARTVPLAKKHGSKGFDVCCNSACCQVYSGLHQISAENNAIVDSTRGLYCAYQGAPISVLYHNSNGGASCSSVAAWGGNEVPYLTTVFVDENGETDKWEETYTKTEFYEYLGSRNSFSFLADADITMKILETDPYGSDYITVLSVSDGSGNSVEIRTSEDVRSACGFDSANFDLEYSADALVLNSDGTVSRKTVSGVLTADGYKEFSGFGDNYQTTNGGTFGADKVVIKGEGAGHGVGFSAVGSEALAKDGYSYKYIIEHFFKGTQLIQAG